MYRTLVSWLSFRCTVYPEQSEVHTCTFCSLFNFFVLYHCQPGLVEGLFSFFKNSFCNRETLLNFRLILTALKIILCILLFTPLCFYSQSKQANFYDIDNKVESIAVANTGTLAKQLAALGSTE